MEIQPFDFDGEPVRVLIDERGEQWWVAHDVARVLGYGTAKDMARRLDDDEKGRRSVPTLGGPQEMTVISEPGLYAAINGSRAEGARRFKRWVTHDVLPQIRRTGSYGAAPALTGPELMAQALLEAQAVLAEKDRQIATLEPRASSYDAFLSADGDMSVAQAAQVLSRRHGIDTGRNRLFLWMEEHGWTCRDGGRPRASQARVNMGHLRMRGQSYDHHRTHAQTVAPPQVRVTPRGLDALAAVMTRQSREVVAS